jgi:TolB protein
MSTPKIFAFLVLLVAGPALAQDPKTPAEGEGAQELVIGGTQTLYQMAVPDAVNMGGAADTRGVTEALHGTVLRDLQISGHFNLIDKSAFLANAAKEGMTPQFTDWFNVGTQGLIKVGYKIQGAKVTVDLRLYSVDRSQRIKLPAPYDSIAIMDVEPSKLRYYAHGFVNEVIRYFTKTPGFFHTRLVAVRRAKRGKELVMLAPDGNDVVQLTRTGGINMLPDLRNGSIYFTSFRNGGAHMFKLAGGKATPIASYKGLNSGAALSPGGDKLACTLSKDGNAEIYVLNPSNGKVISRLTNHWGIDTSPAWSPDGSQIAFVSDRHGSPQIWVMGAGGGAPRRITFKGDYNQTPAWSPKGDKIAFTARDERNVFDIFTVEVGSGKIERLTQNQGNNEEPTWSPDGNYVAFTSTRDGGSHIYLSTGDGRYQTRITKGKGGFLTPAWGK